MFGKTIEMVMRPAKTQTCGCVTGMLVQSYIFSSSYDQTGRMEGLSEFSLGAFNMFLI